MAGVYSLINIGERLRLNPLRSVNNQKRPFTGLQRPRNFIGKVNVAWGIHQIKDIVLTVLCLVMQPNGLSLDGDTALAFNIH